MKLKKLSARQLIDVVVAYNKMPLSRAKSKGADGKFKQVYSILLQMRHKISYDDYGYLFDRLVSIGIRKSLVLHFYINMFLGFDIPTRKCCKRHIPPFTFVKEMFFEQCSNAVAFANRTGGKTLSISIINHLHMTFRKRCKVCTAGSTQEQARNGYEYLVAFHYGDSDGDVAEHAFRVLTDRLIPERKVPTMNKTTYTNASEIKIITGTEKGSNSPHPPKACLDEVDLLDRWKIVQEFLSAAQSSKESNSANIFSSTRKGDQGPFQRLLTYSEKQIKDFPKMPGQPALWKQYRWCIWETVEKCGRECIGDATYGNCPAYRMCKGKAHKVPGGWYKLQDFINKVGSMDEETFRVQWLNERPRGSVRVYGDSWNREIHFIKPLPVIPGDVYYVGGMDFGTGPGHDFVFQIFAAECTAFKREVEETEFSNQVLYTKIRFYLVYEYRAAGRVPMGKRAERIKGGRFYSDKLVIFADPSGAQSRIELYDNGISTYDANNDLEAGISRLREHLEPGYDGKPNYCIFDNYFDCDDLSLIGTDLEFDKYRYKMTEDGRPNPKKPLPINDHGLDCSRYVVLSSYRYFRELFTPQYESIEQEGRLFDVLNAKIGS